MHVFKFHDQLLVYVNVPILLFMEARFYFSHCKKRVIPTHFLEKTTHVSTNGNKMHLLKQGKYMYALCVYFFLGYNNTKPVAELLSDCNFASGLGRVNPLASRGNLFFAQVQHKLHSALSEHY